MSLSKIILGVSVLAMAAINPVFADDEHSKNSNNACPVDLVNGMTLDDEFGPGSQGLTKCLDRRHKVKVVVQINQFCANASNPCTAPYALGNIANMIDDYEVTHGMVQGRDYEMVAIIHSAAGNMALKNTGIDGNGNAVTGRNQFEGNVRGLMARGVKFYFCQNTTRGYIRTNRLPTVAESTGGATAEMIEGMEYTTAGLTSLADFQRRGYMYVQP